jgi:hypothetical protein
MKRIPIILIILSMSGCMSWKSMLPNQYWVNYRLDYIQSKGILVSEKNRKNVLNGIVTTGMTIDEASVALLHNPPKYLHRYNINDTQYEDWDYGFGGKDLKFTNGIVTLTSQTGYYSNMINE